MSIVKKITKNDLIEIAKKYNADKIYIFKIKNIPEIITVDNVDYNLSINGIFNNDKIIGIEINFYNFNNFKHLFDYIKYNNIYDALSETYIKIENITK